MRRIPTATVMGPSSYGHAVDPPAKLTEKTGLVVTALELMEARPAGLRFEANLLPLARCPPRHRESMRIAVFVRETTAA